MRTVRFVAHYTQYNPGEIAGFSEEIARDLVKRGIATDQGESKAARPQADAGGDRLMEVSAQDDGSGSLIR